MLMRWLAWLGLVGVLSLAQPASGQWASLRSDEPFSLDYDGLTELSELLELDAPTHELLVALHLDMMRAENEKREAARSRLEQMQEEGDDVGWRKSFEISIELTEQLQEVGERFFEDVKLIVEPERAPLVDHMRRRSQMGRWLEAIGSNISELGGMALAMVSEQDIAGPARMRELILLHAEQEKRLADQFQRTYEAVMRMQDIGSRIDFDFDNAGPETITEAAEAFTDALESVRRLRSANEALTERVLESLEGDQRVALQRLWWERNYEDIHEPTRPEAIVERLINDEEAGDTLKARVEEIRGAFEDRLRIARKMARVAKYRTDLDFEFSMLRSGTEPEKELYEDALERLGGVAESYASALKGVMTPEQQVKYGLAPGERQIGEPERVW